MRNTSFTISNDSIIDDVLGINYYYLWFSFKKYFFIVILFFLYLV